MAKNKIKKKQTFIEQGMDLLSNSNDCPFCEQELKTNALNLISEYTKYIQDEESQTIKRLNQHIATLKQLKKALNDTDASNAKRSSKFNQYASKYIPSLQNSQLKDLSISALIDEIDTLSLSLEEKINNINQPIEVSDDLHDNYAKLLGGINSDIKDNNKTISSINKKKNSISEENKSIRKQMCVSVFNYLIGKHSDDVSSIHQLKLKTEELKKSIKSKKEQHKANKRDKVSSTIKTVLNYFFSGKYSLDEGTFRLTFNDNILDEGQAKDVLSEGEKNIIAFAYYLGDTHLKIESEDDYSKLFFVIDDPISSMDFAHVYTLCGVIRDLNNIIKDHYCPVKLSNKFNCLSIMHSSTL